MSKNTSIEEYDPNLEDDIEIYAKSDENQDINLENDDIVPETLSEVHYNTSPDSTFNDLSNDENLEDEIIELNSCNASDEEDQEYIDIMKASEKQISNREKKKEKEIFTKRQNLLIKIASNDQIGKKEYVKSNELYSIVDNLRYIKVMDKKKKSSVSAKINKNLVENTMKTSFDYFLENTKLNDNSYDDIEIIDKKDAGEQIVDEKYFFKSVSDPEELI